jgi:uncharacterized protein YciI
LNRATILLLSGITLACFSSQYLATADEQQQATARVNYLVIYRPGQAWVAGKPVEEQPLKEHGKYMLSLYVKGSMKLAGPLTDNAGGAVLLAVANESEAKSIVMEDPAVKNGIFVYEMHPWELKPWDKYANKKK